MHQLNLKNINLLIDFDSTFIKDESLELISNISLENANNRSDVIKQIENITSKAMNGKIQFSEALIERIKLLKANKEHINFIINKLHSNISSSINENKKYFQINCDNCYIVSGGFKEIIYPIVEPFGFKIENIFANEFVYNCDNVISVDQNNPLSQNLGKVIIAKKIKGKNIIIGDGYTDYEIKKFGQTIIFIQYIENINRKNINSKADFIAEDFNKIIEYIDKKYF